MPFSILRSKYLSLLVIASYLLTSCSSTDLKKADIDEVRDLDGRVRQVLLRNGQTFDYGDDYGSFFIKKIVLTAALDNGRDTTIDIVGNDEIHFETRWPRTLETIGDILVNAQINQLSAAIQNICADDITHIKKHPDSTDERTITVRKGSVKIDSVNVRVGRVDRDEVRPPIFDLKDVNMILLEETDAAAVVGNVFLGVTIGVAVLAIIVIASSCPLIYADGKALDAEPLGGAVCRGLQRTDLARLDRLDPNSTNVTISIRNQMRETQFIDEFTVFAVEHPTHKIAVHDIQGGIFTIDQPTPPVSAVEEGRGSILHSVSRSDLQMWETNAADTAALYNGELRDHLTFTFVRPKDAKHAGLVLTAGTSAWGAHMIKQTLSLHGDEVDAWYSRMTTDENERKEFFTMNEREEQYLLKVYIRKGNNWEQRGLLPGNGPLAYEQRIIWLDVSDIEGETIQVRLNPPKMYWSIDQVGMVFNQQQRVAPIPLQRISFMSTVTDTVSSSIARRDGNYHTLASPADRIDATWARPKAKEGSTYTYFLRIGGYYEIDLPKSGARQSALLEEFRKRPGASTEYGLRTFRQYTALSAP